MATRSKLISAAGTRAAISAHRRMRKPLKASELLEAARVYGHQRTHCPNCGQWQELGQSLWQASSFERATDSSAHLKHYPDCHNRCAERGFAPAIKIEEV